MLIAGQVPADPIYYDLSPEMQWSSSLARSSSSVRYHGGEDDEESDLDQLYDKILPHHPQQEQQNQPGQSMAAQIHQQQMMMRSQMGLPYGTLGIDATYREHMSAPNPQVGDPIFNPIGMTPPPSSAMNAPKDNNEELGPGGHQVQNYLNASGVLPTGSGSRSGLVVGTSNGLSSPQPAKLNMIYTPQFMSNLKTCLEDFAEMGYISLNAPPTPVPGSQPDPQQQQQQPGNLNSLSPSPAAMMGVTPTSSGSGGGLGGSGGGGLGGPQLDLTMFNPDFMNNMTTSLKDFTGTTDLFRTTGPDGDINFERDFGQWFINPDDVGAGLSNMKSEGCGG